MRLLDDVGTEVHADFDIEQTEPGFDVILHARSGNKGAESNPAYNTALELILERMRRERATIERVVVDSRPAQTLGIEERTIALGYPVALAAVSDVHELRVTITEGQRLLASKVDPATRGGNKHKRIRLSFKVAKPGAHAERVLGIASPSVDDQARSHIALLGGEYYDDPVDPQMRPTGLYSRDDEKLERSLAEHAGLQRSLARHLRSHGIAPRKRTSGEPDYDIAWTFRERVVVGEVKSLVGAGFDRQLRMGIGQVLQYSELLRRQFGDCVDAVVIVPHDPGGAWRDVCSRARITLTWPPQWHGVEVEP